MKKVSKIIIILLLAIIILSVPHLIKSDYTLHVVNLAGIYAICVMGLVFLLGFAGQLSLGHSALMSIGAYTTGLLAVELNLPFIITFPAAIVVSMLFALLIGIPTLKLKSFYLAMATRGLNIALFIVLINWKRFTHGADGIVNIPRPSFAGFTIQTERAWFYFIVAILIVCYIASRNIEKSRIGRSFKAVKEGELAAEVMGIDVYRTKILAFVLSSALAGTAGCLFAHLNQFICPNDFNITQSVTLLSMSIFGGSEYLLGGVVGAYVLTFLPEALRFLQTYARFINGILILLIMILAPSGLFGVVSSLFEKLKRQKKLDPPNNSPNIADVEGMEN